MALFGVPQAFLLIILTLIFLYLWKCITNGCRNKTSTPTNWPVVGMLPAVFQNAHRVHFYLSQLLIEYGGTFQSKGPWFCNMDLLLTCDPNNIHHVFSKNFSNYPKGPEFRKIFDILGDGIFNADFELWELHRRTTLSFLTDPRFHRMLETTVWGKVETGLIPVLDFFAECGIELDLQDIFQRFTFDSICKLMLDDDPCSLSVDLPYVRSEKAFNDTIEALFYRHVLPEGVWKIQKWLGIGNEGKLFEARKALHEFIYPCVDTKLKSQDKEDDFSLVTIFKKAYEEANSYDSNGDGTRDFLRDTALSLMFAGRDTTSTTLTWLFWLIATNPGSESMIREEMERVLKLKEGNKKWELLGIEESRNLTYLHGALCESLRLFPPVALEHKAPRSPDLLPSGNSLKKDAIVIISFYTTGRMENLWGKDCLEFKPERWITGGGGIRHEPSYKFPAFNAGPRTCLGKEMAFVQMKIIAAVIIYHYNVKLVEGHPVSPRDSIILQAKHGLKVKLSKRND